MNGHPKVAGYRLLKAEIQTGIVFIINILFCTSYLHISSILK